MIVLYANDIEIYLNAFTSMDLIDLYKIRLIYFIFGGISVEIIDSFLKPTHDMQDTVT